MPQPMHRVGTKLLGYSVTRNYAPWLEGLFPTVDAARAAADANSPEPLSWQEYSSDFYKENGFESWIGINVSRLSQREDDEKTIRVRIDPEWKDVMGPIKGARWIEGMQGFYIRQASWGGWIVQTEKGQERSSGATQAEALAKAWKAQAEFEKAIKTRPLGRFASGVLVVLILVLMLAVLAGFAILLEVAPGIAVILAIGVVVGFMVWVKKSTM